VLGHSRLGTRAASDSLRGRTPGSISVNSESNNEYRCNGPSFARVVTTVAAIRMAFCLIWSSCEETKRHYKPSRDENTSSGQSRARGIVSCDGHELTLLRAYQVTPVLSCCSGEGPIPVDVASCRSVDSVHPWNCGQSCGQMSQWTRADVYRCIICRIAPWSTSRLGPPWHGSAHGSASHNQLGSRYHRRRATRRD
jgi:hypothetical protein